MTTKEMLDSLNAVYDQIRADQKREEYEDILVMADEILYFLRNELGCCYPTIGNPAVGTFEF